MRSDSGGRPPVDEEHGIVRRVLVAAALVAVLDGLFAVGLSAALRGTLDPPRVFQGIARAALGPPAMTGGLRTALIGLAMHFGVALAWTTLYLLLVRHVGPARRLVRRVGPLLAGVGYGVVVWLGMNLVVVPLTLNAPTPIASRVFLWLLLGHMVVVGPPIALVVGDGGRR